LKKFFEKGTPGLKMRRINNIIVKPLKTREILELAYNNLPRRTMLWSTKGHRLTNLRYGGSCGPKLYLKYEMSMFNFDPNLLTTYEDIILRGYEVNSIHLYSYIAQHIDLVPLCLTEDLERQTKRFCSKLNKMKWSVLEIVNV
jgi:hypothetical protein